MNVFEEKGITHLYLHGVKHKFVAEIVIDFIYRYQDKIPLIIICGNSNKMIDLVLSVLKENNIKGSSPRYGILRIEQLG